jgi:serine protease DegQ
VLAYGNFLTILLNFLILAFIIFQMVRLMNRMRNASMRRKKRRCVAADAGRRLLLREIRDSLKNVKDKLRVAAMRRTWLLFAQTVTIALGLYAVIAACVRTGWALATRRCAGPGRHRRPGRAVPVLQAPAVRDAGQLPRGGRARDAGRGQHPHQQGAARNPSAAEGPVLPPLLRRQAAAAGTDGQPGLGRDRQRRRLHPDQFPRGRRRRRDRGRPGRWPQGRRQHRRHRSGNRPGRDPHQGGQPAGDRAGRPDEARVGDVVLAIGNPFGVGQTVTLGIISALGRNNLHINHFENFIQTDAAINFGNSGGALVDTRGNLLGINSAIYSQTGGSVGIGFAIPVSTAKPCSIPSSSTARWCAAGSASNPRTSRRSWPTASASGATAAPSSPAWCAAARPTAPACARATSCCRWTARRSSSTNDMLNLIADLPPGGKSRMTVMRKNREATLDVTVGRRPRQTP